MHTYEDSNVRNAISEEIKRTQTLNDLMSFGHVVYSDGNGNVTDEYDDTMYGPEVIYVETDENGSIARYGNDDVASERHSIDMAGYGDWELLHGFTGQCGYRGSLMHPSEFIGGGLERHIRENRGYYVAVMVNTYDDDGDDDGSWAVAFHEVSES